MLGIFVELIFIQSQILDFLVFTIISPEILAGKNFLTPLYCTIVYAVLYQRFEDEPSNSTGNHNEYLRVINAAPMRKDFLIPYASLTCFSLFFSTDSFLHSNFSVMAHTTKFIYFFTSLSVFFMNSRIFVYLKKKEKGSCNQCMSKNHFWLELQ